MVRLLWFWSDQFLKVNIKFHCYKKQVRNRSASVIFGLVRLTRKNIKKCRIISSAHIQIYCYAIKVFCYAKKLSNKQSSSVIFRPARLITLYYN